MVALACVLASCSSEPTEAESTPTQSAPTQSALERAAQGVDYARGYPLPDCSPANGELCITNGFDPARDGFGFANWGEQGTIGATEMIALFGRKNVCASGSARECVMYPAAEQWAAQVNEATAGGHCEGMAVLSARLFLGDEAITRLDPVAESTFDLDPSDRDVVSAIEMWFATQYVDPVVRAYQSYLELTPTEIASALIDGLEAGTGYTLGIYSEDGGHAVTPLGVGVEDGQVAISIYDNNYPGTVQRIMIDPDTETWSYAGGTTEPNAPTNGWSGSTGTIELTPMESRALPAPAPFSEKRTSGRTAARKQTILVTSPDRETMAGAVLDVNGKSFDLTDPSTSLPDGVLVRTNRGDTLTSGSTIVDIDRALVGDYAIRATTQNPSGSTVPVTISIDSVGKPRVTMQADSPSTGAGGAQFSVDATGAVTAETATGAAARVSIANGLSGASFELAMDNSLVIDTDRQGVASARLFDDEGVGVGTYTIDDETDNGLVTMTEIEFDPQTGEFVVTDVDVDAEEVDTAFLDIVDGVSDDAIEDEVEVDVEADAEAKAEAEAEAEADDSQMIEDDTASGTQGGDQGPGDTSPVDEGNDEGRLDDAPADDAPADDAPMEEVPAEADVTFDEGQSPEE